jgi:hypothetical protein
VLVIANETIVGEPLLDKIRGAKQGPARSCSSRRRATCHPEHRRRSGVASARSPSARRRHRGARPVACGPLPPPPGGQDERIDEIIVSTFPGEKTSSWLRGDLVNRLRKQTGLPVEHVEVAPVQEPVAQ